jgi:hypothetical protein
MIKQTLIIDYFVKKRKNNDNSELLNGKKKRICGYNSETESWHCLDCGIDMGQGNPRQLCGKYYCKDI